MPLIALPPPYFINEIKVNGHKLKTYHLKHFDEYDDDTLSAIISALPPVGTPGYDYAVDKLFMEEPQDRKTSWKSRWEYSIKPTRFFLDRNPEVPGTGIAIPDDNKH